jgi:SET domain-containing protein
MLLVKTRVGESPIHGLGLFADQFIPKGTVVWQFSPAVDSIHTEEEVARLPEGARGAFLKYSYRNKRTLKYTLCGDDARFCNHSDDPNVKDVWCEGDAEGLDVAARDIAPGEEITNDYREFEHDLEQL